MNASTDNQRQERRLNRERAARKRAEELLETKSRELYDAQQELKASFSATVEVFANLIGGKGGRTSKGMRRMGQEAMALARRCGLSSEQAETIYLATLLCDLGKLMLPDDVLSKAYISLNRQEREVFHQHPQMAYESLIALPPLQQVASAVLGHCELENGRGYPRGLSGSDILLESKVIGLVKDFDGLRQGLVVDGELTDQEAIEYLNAHAGDRYDPELVTAFIDVHAARAESDVTSDEQRLTPISLKPGMVLTRDVHNQNGVLMLPAGRKLQAATIEQLRKFVEETGRELLVYVIPDDDEGDSGSAIPRISATISL